MPIARNNYVNDRRIVSEEEAKADYARRYPPPLEPDPPIGVSKPEPVEPTGVLAKRITTAADAAGVKVEDLLVLSEANDPYTAWRRRRDAEVFARLLDQFVAPDRKRHLRGLFYRCIMIPDTASWPNGKPLINTHGNWVKFQQAAAAAR